MIKFNIKVTLQLHIMFEMSQAFFFHFPTPLFNFIVRHLCAEGEGLGLPGLRLSHVQALPNIFLLLRNKTLSPGSSFPGNVQLNVFTSRPLHACNSVLNCVICTSQCRHCKCVERERGICKLKYKLYKFSGEDYACILYFPRSGSNS